MASLDCQTGTVEGVTLVELHLSADVAEQVRVEPVHQEPVWPPRRQGVPAAGWDDAGWTGTVTPEEPVALGYATPADLGDEPAEIVSATPATETTESPTTPREVVRALGDPAPPRDAVPDRDADDIVTGAASKAASDPATDPPQSRPHGSLAEIERRLEIAEDLAAASSVAEATAAVEAVGGIEAVRDLERQLAADERSLDELLGRARRLRERANRIDVPVETLARVT